MLKIIQVKQEAQTRAELIDSLVSLEKSLFHRLTAWDADDFLEALDDKKTKLIVLIDSEDSSQTVQGYCLYEQFKKKIDISSLAVSSLFKGQNYGFSMLKLALDSASNKPDFLITIDCMPTLMPYYAKMGFEEYGKRDPGYYELTDDEIDGVHMKVSKERFDAIALSRSIATTMPPLEELNLENNMKRPS